MRNAFLHDLQAALTRIQIASRQDAKIAKTSATRKIPLTVRVIPAFIIASPKLSR